MTAYDALVLGAGMVGVSTAIHLRKRGLKVALVDRRAPGEETSFGNAGIIQREGVHPYLFPRDLRAIVNVALKRGGGPSRPTSRSSRAAWRRTRH
jgi:D-amino-acid dehydrogenase